MDEEKEIMVKENTYTSSAYMIPDKPRDLIKQDVKECVIRGLINILPTNEYFCIKFDEQIIPGFGENAIYGQEQYDQYRIVVDITPVSMARPIVDTDMLNLRPYSNLGLVKIALREIGRRVGRVLSGKMRRRRRGN